MEEGEGAEGEGGCREWMLQDGEEGVGRILSALMAVVEVGQEGVEVVVPLELYRVGMQQMVVVEAGGEVEPGQQE